MLMCIVLERQRRMVMKDHARLGGERRVGATQSPASRKVDELLVETNVTLDQPIRRLFFALCLPLEVLHGGGKRGEGERFTPGHQQLGRIGLNCLTSFVDVAHVLIGEETHSCTAVKLMLDQALLNELADGLADHTPPGAEHGGDLYLPQGFTLRNLAADDRRSEC